MTTPTTQTVPAPVPAKVSLLEDPTDFERCDVSVNLLLHRYDGDPKGRLVSVIVHNFSGPPLTQDFREADLTDKSALDNIQQAIFPVMQRFLLELAERRKEKLEAEAKRSSRVATSASAPKPPLSSKPPVPSSLPQTVQSTTPVQPHTATGKEKGKKDAGTPAPTTSGTAYQQISMF